MKTESLKGDDFILHICKDRSTVPDHPYQMIIASKYVWPSFSREELKDVADFINEFVEKN
jgi:hypothetical protein